MCRVCVSPRQDGGPDVGGLRKNNLFGFFSSLMACCYGLGNCGGAVFVLAVLWGRVGLWQAASHLPVCSFRPNVGSNLFRGWWHFDEESAIVLGILVHMTRVWWATASRERRYRHVL